MASYDLTGKIAEIYDTQQVTDTFRKREFVVETNENSNGRDFTEYIKFQAVQERCNQLDNFSVGDTVKVSFNIRGRRYEKNDTVSYFSNLEAWRIAKDSDAPVYDSYNYNQEPPASADAPPAASAAVDDDLPF